MKKVSHTHRSPTLEHLLEASSPAQPLNLLTLEKDLAGSMGLNIDDFNQRIKVHEHLGNLILEFLNQHHQAILRRHR